jgi:hypothetical protein
VCVNGCCSVCVLAVVKGEISVKLFSFIMGGRSVVVLYNLTHTTNIVRRYLRLTGLESMKDMEL